MSAIPIMRAAAAAPLALILAAAWIAPQALAKETAKETVVTAAQPLGGDVRWILPGPRRLDPALFGTPDQPLGTGAETGLPLKARAVSPDGSRFTTTLGPTPFSDSATEISGTFDSRFVDHTPADSPDSKDEAAFEAIFTSPGGAHGYRVVLQRILPAGPKHTFGGGVITDARLHGTTGIGTRLMPTVRTYASFWGVASLYVDDRLVSDKRLIHVMATEHVREREGDYRLLFDSALTGHGVHTHLILPATVVTPEGPQARPVGSRFAPSGAKDQPFIHVMFEDTNLEGLPILQ